MLFKVCSVLPRNEACHKVSWRPKLGSEQGLDKFFFDWCCWRACCGWIWPVQEYVVLWFVPFTWGCTQEVCEEHTSDTYFASWWANGQIKKLHPNTAESCEEKANDETLVQLVDEIEQRVIGSQSSSRVSTEELHVPPPSPSIHLEASSAPEKVIQYFTFTMF